ncbi:MAG: deoxyribodipyrimidine photo-lyase, partial [Propionibacteriaceae bacterium]|nr:deoxyribodipyrimidine photo-lyase [Propionibacteriaceae bacterium]
MSSTSTPTLWWVRRDFRLADNPALVAAVASGSAVLPLFVLDPRLLSSAGKVRTAWLMASLRVLDADLRLGGGPGLSVLTGNPQAVVPNVAKACGAESVHISADFAPYGTRRDRLVRAALQDASIELCATGSPYAVAPGTLTSKAGAPFQVFTPFWRAWADHGVRLPAAAVDPGQVSWLATEGRVELVDDDPDLTKQAGEDVALESWHNWLERDHDGVDHYAPMNDFPGADATSHLSIALRWGHLHPRTILAGLAQRATKGAAAHARQIAWRDFFADVLYHRPDAVTRPIKADYAKMATDEPDSDAEVARRLRAWQYGLTGYPLVDAGMRQLLAEGWMHNRVRMVTASFLVKDLHIGWWHGADWFMQHLRDGDIAQNQLNWQWVAGCGTDASPYFRVFNPTGQAAKFDADGEYIRRYLPELAGVAAKYLHEPWTAPEGSPAGYPSPIVDHAQERRVALARYET